MMPRDDGLIADDAPVTLKPIGWALSWRDQAGYRHSGPASRFRLMVKSWEFKWQCQEPQAATVIAPVFDWTAVDRFLFAEGQRIR